MTMLEKIFIFMSGMMSKSIYPALAGSFFWGILSVILSPCHLGNIPLVVAFINGQGKITFKKAFFISSLFSFGMFISISIIGIITGISGRILGNIGNTGTILVAVIFFTAGLNFLNIIPFPGFLQMKHPDSRKKGLFSGFFLGMLSGLALGPCTFAFMSPVLAISFKSGGSGVFFSIFLFLSYAAGHCGVFIFFGTFSELVQKFLNWDEKSKGTAIVKKLIGIIMIFTGLYLVYNIM